MNKQVNPIILAIESSCDESAASIITADKTTGRLRILSNIVSSQIEIHKKYGGVVPEIAAREHVLNILPVINEALTKAKITPDQLSAIAVTKGPGLITSLIAGAETARSLAYAWSLPIIEVNHIEGHIYANFIDQTAPISYPALILTVSGGHTTLLTMEKSGRIKIIGETRDDAAGEAYDKAAKMMNLGYPGGPIISKLASEYNKATTEIKLPRPMLNSPDYDFSFSGLKTALLYELKKDSNWKKRISEYAFAYQQAILDVLIHKTLKAAKNLNSKTVMVAGGVSANEELRKQMASAIKTKLPEANFLIPKREYTTDNAAMIAAAAYFRFKKDKTINYKKLKVDSGLELR